MLSDLAFSLSERGRQLIVITSRQRYDEPDAVLPAREQINGVDVHRVWTSRFGRHNLIGRAGDYLTFYLTSTWTLWHLARSGDVVVAKTDPPMLSVLAWPVARWRGARLINWLQDIFPEIAERFGSGGLASRLAYRMIRLIRNPTLKSADMNVAVGERMAEHVQIEGVDRNRIVVIPNWTDGHFVHPIAHVENPLRQSWELGTDFVVGYSGNLGRAHDIETFLFAMSAVRQHVATLKENGGRSFRVRWLFIGGGALVGDLKSAVSERELDEVTFKSYVRREDLAESLSAPDVHLVSLRPEMEGLVVPSKIYGIAAAGRPAIFIGDADGEVARIIAHHDFGRSVAQGDGAALARAILDMAEEPAACREMGKRARQAFEAEFDKPAAVDRWHKLLDDLTSLG